MSYQLEFSARPTGPLGFPPQRQYWKKPTSFTKSDIKQYRDTFFANVVERFHTSKTMQKYIEVTHKIIKVEE